MPKKIYISLIILILLLMFILFYERFTLSTDQLIKNKDSLISLPLQTLKKITFQGIEITKEKQNYHIFKQIKLPADQKKCSDLFTRLSSIKAINTITDQLGNLKYYGLDKGYIVLHLYNGDNKDILYVGNQTKDKGLGECYAKLENSNKIYVINVSVRDALLKSVNYYLDEKPFEFVQTGEVYLKWKNGKQDLLTITKEDELFFISSVDQFWPGNSSLINPFFELISNVQIKDDLAVDFNDLENEHQLIIDGVIKGKKGSRLFDRKFFIFQSNHKEKKQYYLTFSKDEVAFSINAKIVEFFINNDFAKLCSTSIFDGPVKNLRSIEFVNHQSKKVFKFQGNKMQWEMLHPYNWLFSSGKIFNFILKYVIQEVEFDQTLKDSGELLFSVLFDYESKKRKRFKTGVFKSKIKNSKNLVVKHNNSSTSARTGLALLQKLSIDPFSFVSKKPFLKVLNKAYSFKIIDDKKQEVVATKNSLGSWIIDKKDKAFDFDDKQLISSMKESTCYNAMESREGVDFGFDQPFWVFSFMDKDSNEFFKILVGSFSKYEESFVKADDKIFMLFKDFFLFELLKKS